MRYAREEIVERLKDILLSADEKNRAAVERCTEDSRLLEDFGLSSVGMLYMVIAIEETFDVRFENVSVTDFGTLGDVVTFIQERLR